MSGELERGFLVGEYRVERRLGQGGMGTVYLAVQPLLDKRVAVKVLQPALSDSPQFAQRFLDEARAAVQIGHRNIVDIFTFGRLPDGRLYYVMEFLEGCTLSDRLEAGDLGREELRRLLGEICEALGEAHRHQIVHRDLKPDNIWIARPTRGLSYAKILDFGIAKLVRGADKLTLTGTQIGTPRYMAPEQWRGRGVDHHADLYSLGVILYLIFAGRLPFEEDNTADLMLAHLMNPPRPPSNHRPMAPALERLILDCLAKEPAARPGSASEVAQRLDHALAAGEDGARAPDSIPSASAQAGTRAAALSVPGVSPVALPVTGGRRPLIVGLAIAVAGVVGAVWLAMSGPATPVAVPSAASPHPLLGVAGDQRTPDAVTPPNTAAVTPPNATTVTPPPAAAPIRRAIPREKKTVVTSRLPAVPAPASDGAPTTLPAAPEPPARKPTPAEEAGLVEKVQREPAR